MSVSLSHNHNIEKRESIVFSDSIEGIDFLKGAVGSADLKISKSALLSLNHQNFSNTKPIYTE